MSMHSFTIDVSTNATVCVGLVAFAMCFIAWIAYKRAKLPERPPQKVHEA